jgi:hypothetical protein
MSLEDYYRRLNREFLQLSRQQASILEGYDGSSAYSLTQAYSTKTQEINGGETLTLIKQSIKEINTNAVDEQSQAKIRAKINRLNELGATKQAQILALELQLRFKLCRIGEWDYKVLPAEAIKKYKISGRNWDGQGGYFVVHIVNLEAYSGQGDCSVMPDEVLDKLEEAKQRQIFDEFSVLWVEKVKDPLLLGSISGCLDYFFICEWGEDVSFDEIMKDNPNPDNQVK